MKSLSSSIPYPPSSLASLHLNKLLDSHLPTPVSSTSSTFTLPTSNVVSNVNAYTMSSCSPLPPMLSLLPQLFSLHLLCLFFFCPRMLRDFSFAAILCSPSIDSRSAAKNAPPSEAPAVAPDEAGTSTERNVHTAVYEQKLTKYNDSSELYERINNQILSETVIELSNIGNNVNAIVNHLQNPTKLIKFKSLAYNVSHIPPLHRQLPPHICENCFQF